MFNLLSFSQLESEETANFTLWHHRSSYTHTFKAFQSVILICHTLKKEKRKVLLTLCWEMSNTAMTGWYILLVLHLKLFHSVHLIPVFLYLVLHGVFFQCVQLSAQLVHLVADVIQLAAEDLIARQIWVKILLVFSALLVWSYLWVQPGTALIPRHENIVTLKLLLGQWQTQRGAFH